MGGTLLIGLIVASVMFLSGGSNPASIPSHSPISSPSNENDLKIKINNIYYDNVSPQYYNTLKTEILSSHQAKTINDIWKDNLLIDLDNKYGEEALKKINQYFNHEPMDEFKMQPFMDHLSFIGQKKQEVNQIKSKVQQIKYYTQTLPSKVYDFNSNSLAVYDENKYLSLKSEVETMKSLDGGLRNRSIVISTKQKLLSSLTSRYREWVDYNDIVN